MRKRFYFSADGYSPRSGDKLYAGFELGYLIESRYVTDIALASF